MRRARRGAAACMLMACAVALGGCATSGDGVDTRQAAEANASLGADYLRRNENDQAVARFRRALDYDSDNASAVWGMAIVKDRLDEPEAARRYYERAVDLRPNAPVYNSYAAFLCRQDEVDRALEYFDRAADDPRYAGAPDARANAGLCLERAGRGEAAERYYRDALEGDGEQFTALVHMARLMYDRGEYLSARGFIERADAAADLEAEQLRLAARIELALGDRGAAADYVGRYNASRPAANLSLRQLEQSR